MIKIGIVGLGNVALNVHLPILLSRNDVIISWICEENIEKKSIIENKQINFFSNINEIPNIENVDIVLIATPYGVRREIFDKIKNKCNGVFFEKPYAINLEEHNYFTNFFKSSSMTVGYTRRKMGIVQAIKKIIDQKIFGNLISIKISFGDIHYKFDNFRSEIKQSGGGIFFEAGTHWFDCVLFTTYAQEILKFNSEKKYENKLDIESFGDFDIIDYKKNQIKCEFIISTLKNTQNKIEYNFDNCSIDLYLFDNSSNLKVKNNKNSEFIIKDNEFLNFPNSSFDVAGVYWNDFLNSFKSKTESDISYNTFFLTSKIVELFYGR